MHEQVAPETFVLNAFLDTCDLQAGRNGSCHMCARIAEPSPDSRPAILARRPCEGLREREHHSYSASFAVLHHRQRGPTDAALNLPGAQCVEDRNHSEHLDHDHGLFKPHVHCSSKAKER